MKTASTIYSEFRTAHKKTRTHLLGRPLLAILFLLAVHVAPALSTEEPADSGATHEAEGAKLTIPKTLPALWGAIGDHQKELHETLAAKKLADVHVIAFAIRDYVAALPGKSASLPAAAKLTLKKSVTRVGSLAKLLDEAGDAGDSAKTASLVGKLDTELKSVESLYPAKDLKSTAGATDIAKLYVCPMHPEVTSEKPGKCPKCGMDLVRKGR